MCGLILGAAFPVFADEFDRDLPRIDKPQFHGNKTFSADDLLAGSFLRLRPFWQPWAGSTPYRKNTFAKELRRIEEVYRARGFGSASVHLDSVVVTGPHRVKPVVGVHEGPRTRIREVRFLPQDVFSLDELRSLMPFHDGDPYPFSVQVQGRATLALRLAFLSRGYLGIVVQDSTALSADSTSALVVYQMSPGERYSVHSLRISGNTTTRPELVRRELRIDAGDTYSYDKIAQSQRNLYSTGLFKSATIIEDSLDVRTHTVDLSVRVAERKMAYWEAGVGVGHRDQYEARASAAWGHRNLFGRGHAVELRSTLAYNVEKRGRNYFAEQRLGYAQPHFLGTNVRFSPALSYVIDRRVDDVQLRGPKFEAPASLDVSKFISVAGVLSVTQTTTEIAGQKVLPGQELLSDRELQTRAISATVTRKASDNPFDPHRGSVAAATVQRAGFGGDNQFTKGFGSYGHYLAFGNSVLALGVRAGWVEPFGGRQLNIGIRGVPFEYLFQAGGASSVRGFDLNSLGPEVLQRIRETNPDGGVTASVKPTQRHAGTILLVTNIELRRPMPWLPARWNLGWAAFVDAGNVWESTAEFRRARFGPRVESHDFEITDVRYGCGLGVRWMAPFGPIRMDLGFPAKPHYKGKVAFAVGHAF